MHLRVAHTTTVTYPDKATASYYVARLTPRSSAEQLVVSTRLEVSPTPYTSSYRDYFGTAVTAFEVLDPHDELTVTATSTVHTQRPAPHLDATLSWADLAAPEVADRLSEYLDVAEATRPTDDLLDRLDGLRAESPGATALAVAALVREQVEVVAGRPPRGRPGLAWARRAGTVHDLAHLTAGGLRSLGIPARYVTGYVHPEPDAAPGQEVTGAPHAWVQWWDDGWRAFDPAGGRPVGDAHVQVAVGRDHDDVRPLGGVYSGGSGVEAAVRVRVTRLP